MKKLIFTSILILGILQCFSQTQDTIVLKNGAKIACKVIIEGAFSIGYEVKGKLEPKTKYINVEKVNFIKKKQPEQTNYNLQDDSEVTDIEYLMNENALLKKQQNQLAVNIKGMFANINIAGNMIKNAGYFSLGALGAGIISGLCLGLSQKASIPENARIAGYVFAGIAGICTIAIPIDLISAGGKLKKIK
jgi:hypothetical protein